MNVSNNIRYQSTEEKIEKALVRLLKRKHYDNIFVKDICLEAGINRSSFYDHYLDINDLMMKYEDKISHQITEIFKNSDFQDEIFEKMFEFVKENADFYRAYLKSNQALSFVERNMFKYFRNRFKTISSQKSFFYTDQEIEYHMCFFGAGLRSICERWLCNGCKESPQVMANIIKTEYENSTKYSN
ncbi:MAG: TetR/AcrR family transcriptional regulator [Candidatus Caccovivens sp.]